MTWLSVEALSGSSPKNLNTPENWTKEKINQTHDEIQSCMDEAGAKTKEKVIALGNALTAQKEALKTKNNELKKKGKKTTTWKDWVKDNLDFSYSTANRYINCANEEISLTEYLLREKGFGSTGGTKATTTDRWISAHGGELSRYEIKTKFQLRSNTWESLKNIAEQKKQSLEELLAEIIQSYYDNELSEAAKQHKELEALKRQLDAQSHQNGAAKTHPEPTTA